MKRCPICGKPVEIVGDGHDGKRRYCSAICRERGRYIKQREVEKLYPPKEDCFAYDEKKDECRAMKRGTFPCKTHGECKFYKRGKWEQIGGYKTCVYCGKMFVPPQDHPSMRYCSEKCRKAYLNVNKWTNVRKEET